jgi:hypothetical protein
MKFIAKAFGFQKINAPIIVCHITEYGKTIPLNNMQANSLISITMFLYMINRTKQRLTKDYALVLLNEDLHRMFRTQNVLTIILHYLVGPDDFDLISTLFPAYTLPTSDENKE